MLLLGVSELLQAVAQLAAFPARDFPHLRRVLPYGVTLFGVAIFSCRLLGFLLGSSEEKGQIKPPVFKPFLPCNMQQGPGTRGRGVD